MEEKRRGPRVASEFWIAVEGIDPQARRRRGNISDSGIYFETERPIGGAGSVQWIDVASPDRKRSVELMGRVIRTVAVDDVTRGSLAGVALELMPESVDKRHSLEALITHLMSSQLDVQLSALLEPQDARPAAPSTAPERLVLHSPWRAEAGDLITVELGSGAPGDWTELIGRVVDVAGAPGGQHRVELRLEQRTGQQATAAGPAGPTGRRVGGDSVVDAIDALFADLTVVASDVEPGPREHLAGLLSRLRLPSLLTLFEMERMSGHLELVNNGRQARVFLREGCVIDAEDGSRREPREVLADLVTWQDGSFEYRVGETDRPDRIATPTTALLLDLARLQDEAARRTPA